VRYQLKHLLTKATKPVIAETVKQITVIDSELNDLRKGLLYYHEASTLDNIHALGIDL